MRRNLIVVPKPVRNAFNAFAKRASLGRYKTPEQMFNGLLSYGNDCYIDGTKNGLVIAGAAYIAYKAYKWYKRRNCKNGENRENCYNDIEEILPTM